MKAIGRRQRLVDGGEVLGSRMGRGERKGLPQRVSGGPGLIDSAK